MCYFDIKICIIFHWLNDNNDIFSFIVYMSQVDLSVYISIIEYSLILFLFFYIIFVLFFIYPLFKQIILSNRLFVKILNDICLYV